MADQKTLAVIIPFTNTKYNAGIQGVVNSVLAPDFRATYQSLTSGADFIQSRDDEFLNSKEIIDLAKAAEQAGCAGILIDGATEPAVSIVRELVDIPVVGAFDAPVLTANLISRRYSVVTALPCMEPMQWTLTRDLGVADNMVSIRCVYIPVADLDDTQNLKAGLYCEATLAILEEEAEAIVLGCTGMLGAEEDVSKWLEQDHRPAPIVDATKAAVCFLQALVRCGLTQSRLCYYDPDAPPVPFRRRSASGVEPPPTPE